MTIDQTNERAFVLTDLVLGIDHVGIAVPDLDAAIAFYTDVIGMVERHREVNTEQGDIEAMLTVRRPGRLHPTATPGPADPGVDDRPLSRPIGSGSSAARAPGGRHRPGRWNPARQVTPAALRQARRGTDGTMINFIHPKDAGGVLVELVQYDPVLD